MRIDGLDKELQEKVKTILNEAEDKSAAIYEAAEMIVSAKYEKLISEIAEQNRKAAADESYRRSLGLHALSKEETEFYEKAKDFRQAITGKQIDILPTSIVDRTLDSVKKKSDILSLIQFAPADVKKWLVAEHEGSAVWGELTGAVSGELSATFKSMDIEQHKMTVFLIIPKAIRDLALPFVDRYFIVGNFTATFVCEGYQYAIEGQYPLELKFTEGNESKYCIVRNSYDTSYPLYQISGNGTFDLEVNGKHMRGSCAGRLTIDTDREISYKDNKSANTDVTGTYKDLSLEEDENIVKITQGFDLVIIPRWRE